MRNLKIIAFTLIGTAFLFGSFGLIQAQTLSKGMQGEEIKNIQEILRTDTTIYPQGLVTGYYGRLTEEAVKKIQKRCGISETGNVDESTVRCIYPIGYQVKVLSPNGGESWDRSQIQTVRWEAISQVNEEMKIPPFWSKASIDLFKIEQYSSPCSLGQTCPEMLIRKSVFVRHIATVNLFDGSYSWKISNDIPNSSDYVIRVSVGKNIVPLWLQEKLPNNNVVPEEIWIKTVNWDESDGPFTIAGERKPQPTPDIEKVIKILEKISQEINQVIVLLKGMTVTYQ